MVGAADLLAMLFLANTTVSMLGINSKPVVFFVPCSDFGDDVALGRLYALILR
jgi:hypothetical protein